MDAPLRRSRQLLDTQAPWRQFLPALRLCNDGVGYRAGWELKRPPHAPSCRPRSGPASRACSPSGRCSSASAPGGPHPRGATRPGHEHAQRDDRPSALRQRMKVILAVRVYQRAPSQPARTATTADAAPVPLSVGGMGTACCGDRCDRRSIAAWASATLRAAPRSSNRWAAQGLPCSIGLQASLTGLERTWALVADLANFKVQGMEAAVFFPDRAIAACLDRAVRYNRSDGTVSIALSHRLHLHRPSVAIA